MCNDICRQYFRHLLMETAKRQKLLVAVALLLIVERERRKQQNNKTRIWARYWLQRRNTISNTLTMLHKELRL